MFELYTADSYKPLCLFHVFGSGLCLFCILSSCVLGLFWCHGWHGTMPKTLHITSASHTGHSPSSPCSVVFTSKAWEWCEEQWIQPKWQFGVTARREVHLRNVKLVYGGYRWVECEHNGWLASGAACKLSSCPTQTLPCVLAWLWGEQDNMLTASSWQCCE